MPPGRGRCPPGHPLIREASTPQRFNLSAVPHEDPLRRSLPAGYTPAEVLHQGSRTLVLRARASDGTTVLMKTPAEEVPTARVLGRYRHEHRILQDLDGDGAVRPIGLLEHQGRPLLVLEDHHAVSLATLLTGDPLPNGQALDLAVGLATALDRLHAHGLIHKDLKPDNAVVAPDHTVRWIDLGLASRLEFERAALTDAPLV